MLNVNFIAQKLQVLLKTCISQELRRLERKVSKMAKTLRKLGYSDLGDDDDQDDIDNTGNWQIGVKVDSHCYFFPCEWSWSHSASIYSHTCSVEESEVTRKIETTTPLTTSNNNSIVFPTPDEVNNTTTTPESELLCPSDWTRIGEACYQFVTHEWVFLYFLISFFKLFQMTEVRL